MKTKPKTSKKFGKKKKNLNADVFDENVDRHNGRECRCMCLTPSNVVQRNGYITYYTDAFGVYRCCYCNCKGPEIKNAS